MMNIALFGGSFDPPHLAHWQVAEFLLEEKEFDEVWIIPAGTHPFKKSQASFEDRIAMCRLAFASLGKKVKVLEDEKDLSGYTIDLIEHLEKKFPQAHFTFVLGSDLKTQLKDWKNSEALQKKINFEFLPRPPTPSSFAAISSSEIREKIHKGKELKPWLSQEVQSYILHHHLY